MERGSLEKLKFDKRLQLRRGWVSEQDTSGHIESLPDVSDKIAVESADQPDDERDVEPVAEVASASPEVADDFGDRPADPLSPPPFKEV